MQRKTLLLVYTPVTLMKLAADKRFWLATIVFTTIALGFIVRSGVAHRSTSATNLEQLPSVILWAWERPEDLSFIDTNKVGVAFLAKTITLRGNEVTSRPRLQPLNIRSGTKLVAVVRIESDRKQVPTLTTMQSDQTLAELVSTARRDGIHALQIDFDATLSQREFYRSLLKQLRQSLANNLPISITALASWCAGDNWLEDLPIDEAVPMMFRLGVEKRKFQSGYQFSATPCKASAGISTDEPVAVPQVQRLYIFNPGPWTSLSLDNTLEAHNR
jgi:hypothetical protein